MDFLFSIWTMYNYDNTLFDNMFVPTGVDLELLTDNLIVELAEFELLYNDPAMMKFMIEKWSKKEVPQWQKLYDTTVLDYNPIENYNRTETSTETEIRDLSQSENETRNLANSQNETRDLAGSSVVDSDSSGTETKNGTDTVEVYNNAFNSADAILNEKTDNIMGSGNNTTAAIDTTENITDTGTIDKTGTDTGTVDRASTDEGTVSHERNANTYGNIGVTTTQQMIEQERNTVKFNIYDYIINEFKKRFCIMVY